MKFLKFQYGLKQAGRGWNLLLVKSLVEMMELKQCKTEPCIFRKMVDDKVALMVGIRVDDINVSERNVLARDI